jgi:hypothetical protein
MDTAALAALAAIGESLEVAPGEQSLQEIQDERADAEAANKEKQDALRTRLLDAQRAVRAAETELLADQYRGRRGGERALDQLLDQLADEHGLVLRAFTAGQVSEAEIVEIEAQATQAKQDVEKMRQRLSRP